MGGDQTGSSESEEVTETRLGGCVKGGDFMSDFTGERRREREEGREGMSRRESERNKIAEYELQIGANIYIICSEFGGVREGGPPEV